MNAPDRDEPDLDAFDHLVRSAYAGLPAEFRALCGNVVIHVAQEAERDLLNEMGIDDPLELTGLYDGVPLTQKSVSEQLAQPDIIWLFRRAILDEWAARGDVTLSDLVGHVMVHELAHHFGWSDEDIAAIDEWWT